MMKSLILTVMGPDRPGLVQSLSHTVAKHGGNWEESRMARLSGQFAGILLVRAPDARIADMTRDLEALASEGLRVTLEVSTEEPAAPAYRTLHLELVGQDHPGIVREISRTLAAQGINIEALDSHCDSASMSGEMLFHATLQLRVPLTRTTEALKTALEELANELMVDITLDEEHVA